MGERDGLPVVGEQFDIDESQVNLITTAKDVESGIIATPRPTLASSLMLAIMSNIVSTVAIVSIPPDAYATRTDLQSRSSSTNPYSHRRILITRNSSSPAITSLLSTLFSHLYPPLGHGSQA